MAKKKTRKEPKSAPTYLVEIQGIVLVLISIIGICKFGIVGTYFKCFAAFLVGEWYNFFFIATAIIGLYMMIKRERPNYFTSKLLGLYLIVIATLTLWHFVYGDKGFDIIKKTFEHSVHFIKDPNYKIVGGGMIGAVLMALSTALLDSQGTKIVCFFLVIVGVILFTGMSIYDVMKWMKEKASNIKFTKKEKEAIIKAEEAYDKDSKVIISSIDELTGHKEKEKEQSEEVEVLKLEEEATDKTYFCPSVDILSKPAKNNNKENEEAIKINVPLMEKTLKEFDIESKVISARVGPAVTQYELEVKSGTKLSKILSINRELALALAAKEVRIQAPIPGKNTIGIELPNKKSNMVSVREILENVPKALNDSKLLVTMGRDIMGTPQYCEINKTPHLLVAGSTGSGKSVCINSFIVSILMRTRPDEVKLVLVDPKKVELSMYNGVPHLLAPVVTDPSKANIALKKMVAEMDKRYDLFENSATKNIAGYNTYVEKKNAHLPDEDKLKPLPYIVVIIDELADLMLVAAKEVQDSIMRITQMARAAGIHLIVATQRPSTDVITGVIKANIPSRISFAVSSGIDSRTILDATGAEKLLGKGDMLFLPQGENTAMRIQGTFISDEDIKKVVDFTIKQQKARYDDTLTMDSEEMTASTTFEGHEYDGSDDPLYDQVVEFVVTTKKASTSSVQRRFRIGYNRAANLIDKLEERGIVGPSNGSKPREILVALKEPDE